MKRRRLTAVAALAVGLAGMAGLNASIGSTAVPEMARQHIELKKLCVASPTGAPVFEITNVSNIYGPGETISVVIRDGYNARRPLVTPAPIVVAPGETYSFAGEGFPWTSTYQPDEQYFAFFDAVNNKTGKVQATKTHEYCDCTEPTPTSAPETTTTVEGGG